jgi:hypothetical protein
VAPPEAFEGKALWVSHGSADNVIPPSAAQVTRDLARTLPLALSGADFPGAHELRPAELQATVAWLQSLSAPASAPAAAQRRRAISIASISRTQSSLALFGLHQQPVAAAAPRGGEQRVHRGG